MRTWDKSKEAYTLPMISIVPNVYSSRSGKTWYAEVNTEFPPLKGEGKTPGDAVESLQSILEDYNVEQRYINAEQMTTKFL